MESLSKKKEKRMDVDFTNPCPPLPRELLFDVTSACNFRCYFCGNQKKDKGKYIDKEIVFTLMREAKELGISDIGLYLTGEPFLHKDLAEMVAFGKQLEIPYIFLSTNGALATPDRAKQVPSHQRHGVLPRHRAADGVVLPTAEGLPAAFRADDCRRGRQDRAELCADRQHAGVRHRDDGGRLHDLHARIAGRGDRGASPTIVTAAGTRPGVCLLL